MRTKLLCAFCLLSPLALSAADIQTVTPITTDRNIRIEVSLSAGAGERLSLNATITGSSNREKLCSFSKEFVFKNKVDTTVVLSIDQLTPELWSPVSPVLYDLELTADTQTFHKRIGFRKFEMREGVFYLNNKPVYLRGNAINPPERGIPEELERSKEFARDYVRYMKSLNINIIRIPADQNWLDVCDEEGMMVFAGRYGRPKHATATAPPKDFELSLQTYKEVDLGPFTSHPSVVIYILTNEMPYEGKVGDLYRDFLSRMYQELKKWDSTRSYICNAGYGLGKSADIYDVHRYWGWYYNTFLTYLNMRDKEMWQNPGKVQPITFTECVGNYTGIDGRFNLCSRTKQPGSQKCWTGHLPDAEQAEAAMTYQAFVLKNATELFRRLRSQNSCLAGTMPFTIVFHNWDGVKSFAEMKPKPVARQYQLSYQPVLLSWENWQSQVYAGNKLSVVAHVVNDDDNGHAVSEARLRWWIEREGKKVVSGESDFPSVPYYGTAKQALTIDIPQHLLTGNYLLKGEVFSKGKKVSYNESELFIAGKDWKNTSVTRTSIWVYDTSVGQPTLDCLQRSGYPVKPVRSVAELPKNSTLVLGKDSWDDNLNNQVEALKEYVNKGGRVICLEQNEATFNQSWLPVAVEFLKHSNNDPVYLSPSLAYKDGMNINLERPSHPVFKGLTPGLFRLWSDYASYDESQSGFPAIYPVNSGYSLQTAQLKDVAILANYSRALSATALSEMFVGKGSVLLSGFDLISHCGIDPVADKFLSNMIHYMSADKEHERYVAVSDSIIWGDYASEKGIVNGLCNGLMVNTIPLIPEGQEELSGYKVKVDEYGYQFAGSYGGWNSKPGVQYVAYGRRPMAPFTFSRGGSPVVDKASSIGEGYFYLALPGKRKTMTTVFENPVDEPLRVSLSVAEGEWKEYIIQPKQQLSIQTDISRQKKNMKVALKGDRRTILLKTILSTEATQSFELLPPLHH